MATDVVFTMFKRNNLSHSPSLTLTLTLTLTLSYSLLLSPTLSSTGARQTISLSPSLPLSHSCSLALLLSCSLAVTYSLPLSHSLFISLLSHIPLSFHLFLLTCHTLSLSCKLSFGRLSLHAHLTLALNTSVHGDLGPFVVLAKYSYYARNWRLCEYASLGQFRALWAQLVILSHRLLATV